MNILIIIIIIYSGAMIYIPSFIKSFSDIQKLMGGGESQTNSTEIV
jgi:hypothetical protein